MLEHLKVCGVSLIRDELGMPISSFVSVLSHVMVIECNYREL